MVTHHPRKAVADSLWGGALVAQPRLSYCDTGIIEYVCPVLVVTVITCGLDVFDSSGVVALITVAASAMLDIRVTVNNRDAFVAKTSAFIFLTSVMFGQKFSCLSMLGLPPLALGKYITTTISHCNTKQCFFSCSISEWIVGMIVFAKIFVRHDVLYSAADMIKSVLYFALSIYFASVAILEMGCGRCHSEKDEVSTNVLSAENN